MVTLKTLGLFGMDLLQGLAWNLRHELAWQIGAGLTLLWLVHAAGFFASDFSSKQWALKPERPKALRALAYLGALPFRLVFSAFAGGVAMLIWAVLAAFVYSLWRVLHG